ncbi:hypothetical protein RHMOL_Rhmol08G0230900 [Rhododendron molle]|uniref:Uncharacterized protein n=1 Tax=Rhododendron molle TaxID=49168 RepID=A0ACC0MRT4_RHOML|nr:hypothetical protein RHMOL_Rhmol08G0230900 [Rhododendron molle]
MSQNDDEVLKDGNSAEEEETRASSRGKELEGLLIRTVDGRMYQVIEQTVDGSIHQVIEQTIDRRIHHAMEQNMAPMISRMVKELELAGETPWARLNRHSGIGVQSSESRTLELKFLDKLSQPVRTSQMIKGEGNTPFRVALVDVDTKHVVTEASAKVEIVVVDGDFDGEHWTVEEFNKKIVREMEGKKSLLTGNVHLNLEAGVGVICKISFTHNSCWMKACKLRLGAKVVDSFNGARVREAVTEPFVLTDYRITYTEKHFPPFLNDEVWRLKMIQKDGPFHKLLVSKNIKTVKDFLTRENTDPQSLQNILGKLGKGKRWESIVDHARTCKLDKSLHLYFPVGSEKKSGVVFNVVGQVMGLVSEYFYLSIDKLSDDQKANGKKLVVSALEHGEEVKSFNDETFMHSYLQSVNDAYPSNVQRLEIPSLYYREPSHTQSGHDHTQPSTSSHGNQVVVVPSHFPDEGIMPFDPSVGNASDLDVEDLIGDGSGIFPGNSFDPFWESQYSLFIDTDHPYQYQLMNSGAQDLSSFIDGFSSSRAADVAKAHRKWSMLYNVLKSKRKIAALKLVTSEPVLASKRPKTAKV